MTKKDLALKLAISTFHQVDRGWISDEILKVIGICKEALEEPQPKRKREIYWDATEESYRSRKICECGDYDEIIPNQTTIDAINEARQPKEPQYLYIWEMAGVIYLTKHKHEGKNYAFIGKIKLEVDE